LQTLAEQFDAANGGSIQYGGRELHPRYVTGVNADDTIRLTFLRAVDSPVQGIGVKCEKCEVSIAGSVSSSVAL
jgi:hypothetical protein